jgi:hypothetical protein
VPVYRINYEGPSTHAVEAARLLAEADGIELTSSQPPERRGGQTTVLLQLTVEGTDDAVLDAVAMVRGSLPPDARVEIATG